LFELDPNKLDRSAQMLFSESKPKIASITRG